MREELLTNDKQNKLNSNEKNSINWFCLNIHTILAPINAKKQPINISLKMQLRNKCGPRANYLNTS